MQNKGMYGEYISANEEETQNIAKNLASSLKQGDVLCLYGDLGVGKTVFTKALCKSLGVTDYVNSPTFTIVNEYDSPSFPIYHFDLYRIEDLSELYEIGFGEYLENGGIIIMEWPEVAGDLIPDTAININIERTFNTDDERKITIERY